MYSEINFIGCSSKFSAILYVTPNLPQILFIEKHF